VDFAALAGGHGVSRGVRIDDPAELTASVTKALAADRPTVLWLPTSG